MFVEGGGRLQAERIAYVENGGRWHISTVGERGQFRRVDGQTFEYFGGSRQKYRGLAAGLRDLRCQGWIPPQHPPARTISITSNQNHVGISTKITWNSFFCYRAYPNIDAMNDHKRALRHKYGEDDPAPEGKQGHTLDQPNVSIVNATHPSFAGSGHGTSLRFACIRSPPNSAAHISHLRPRYPTEARRKDSFPAAQQLAQSISSTETLEAAVTEGAQLEEAPNLLDSAHLNPRSGHENCLRQNGCPQRQAGSLTAVHVWYRKQQILQFLTFSERPLTIREVVDAIALDTTSKPRFDRKNRMPVPEEVSRYCSSLVSVTRDKQGSEKTVTQLQLAHFSVKEYLMSDRLQADIAEHFEQTNARASIAEVCLAYLLDMDHFLPITELRQSYWLAQYSAQYWMDHAVVAECLTICHKVVRIFLQTLLNKGADVNAQGGRYGNALQAASTQGHEKVVQTLLDKGADVNIQGGEDGNALQAASLEGHEKVVQMLLEKGADVNSQSCLMWRTREGCSDAAREWRRVRHALQAASLKGHEKVAQMLLEKGADVNAKDGNALCAASYGGHEKVVQMLLENGANVNTQSERYGNALWAASLNGHEKVVQMLLEKGADIDAWLFPCLFRAAGCRSTFRGKNKWKKHVNALHVCENVWVCAEGNCTLLAIVSYQQASSEVPFPSGGRVFIRKDLYISHIDRSHKYLVAYQACLG
ncbi:ankyrin repeats (many copies) domain-containing protein [Hirsutella rhossiliensis]